MFERFSKDARRAVVMAQEEARMLDHDRIGPEHLLLGLMHAQDTGFLALLAAAGLSAAEARTIVGRRHRADDLGELDAEALRSIGIDLDAVRESLAASFGPDAWSQAAEPPRRGRPGRLAGHLPLTRDGKKSLELSLREALARRDNYIGSEHVLLAILRAPNDTVRAVLEPHVELGELRRRALALLDSAA